MKNHLFASILSLSLALSLLSGCSVLSPENLKNPSQTPSEPDINEIISQLVSTEKPAPEPSSQPESPLFAAPAFSPDEIPVFSGAPYIAVNDNVPYFSSLDIPEDSFEFYSDLDELGRCGAACANISMDLMPTEKRGEIGMVKPTGWHTVRYDDIIEDKYLYNRCHLIGFQLTGENANEKNLITGTRYLNIEGMLPFENLVADYIEDTGNHVFYLVTPVFEDDNLVCAGVLMEGYSVEDSGAGICFNVFAYNVQPGIEIDYATGESWPALR